jgi:membrane protease YdiL (CAAX protease family)
MIGFGALVLGISALLWGTGALFRETAASAFVLVALTAAGVVVVRPGWNIRPKRLGRPFVVLFGVLLVSAAAAAALLAWMPLVHPYDGVNLTQAWPAILAITGIEELLFRHVLYRWLESRGIAPKRAVAATAIAFGWAHLGTVLVGGTVGAAFSVLQALYMVWIGAVLGEVRRVTGSWAMSWLGHFAYNVAVLFFLSML